MSTYIDIETMLRDLLGYLRACPEANVMASDSVSRRMFGFQSITHGIRWEVSVNTVRNCRTASSKLRMETARARQELLDELRRLSTQGIVPPSEPSEPEPAPVPDLELPLPAPSTAFSRLGSGEFNDQEG